MRETSHPPRYIHIYTSTSHAHLPVLAAAAAAISTPLGGVVSRSIPPFPLSAGAMVPTPSGRLLGAGLGLGALFVGERSSSQVVLRHPTQASLVDYRFLAAAFHPDGGVFQHSAAADKRKGEMNTPGDMHAMQGKPCAVNRVKSRRAERSALKHLPGTGSRL